MMSILYDKYLNNMYQVLSFSLVLNLCIDRVERRVSRV